MRTRWLYRAAACLGLVLAGSMVAAVPAQAYVRETTSNCPNGVQFSGPSVRVILHVGNMGGSPSPAFAVAAAMIRVHAQFNLAGGTTARISSYTTDSSALTYRTWYGDTTPTIHVGFVSSLSNGAIQETSLGPKTNCLYNEAHIAVLDNNVFSWNYLTPERNGGYYYNVDRYDPLGATYFDPSYLHEMLHAFGLAHANSSYAFLDYGVHPWTRDSVSGYDQVTPLPDDVQGLRAIYPDTSTRAEIGLFNSWYEAADPGTPATQEVLCAPSLGAGLSGSLFDPLCGSGGAKSGSTTVCAGDMLRVRYVLANYSTSDVDVTVHLWFSADDTWRNTGDVASSDTQSLTGVNAANSRHYGQSYTVPSLAGFTRGSTLHVIAEADGTTSTGTAVLAWTPLRGTVTVC